MTTLSLILLVVAIACMMAAVALMLRPLWVAAAPAYAAMLLLHFNQMVIEPVWRLTVWGFAMLVCVGLRHMQPAGEPDGRNTGNVYVGLGCLAGALAGMAAGVNFILLGTLLGAFVGMMAFSRTPHGFWLRASSGTFVRYFCAKCLCAIVAAAITVTCLEGLLFYYQGIYKYL